MGFYRNRNNGDIDDEFSEDSGKFGILIKHWKVILLIVVILIVLVLMLLFFNKSDKTITDFGEITIEEDIINYLELEGSSEVNLYQNSDYIEFGYRAYNSKNEDLTNEVKIESNLDIKTIGEYEIVYTLKDIKKIRKVNIVEKPKDYVYIYLNAVNNNVNLFLRAGDEYVEPGYRVFSNSGNKIESDVLVTGMVDTSKAGTYTLVYSVVDSLGYTVSTKRTVIVIDIELDYTLSTKDYTKGVVEISLKANTDKFSYILLPNGDKINSNNYTYEVSDNGEYRFEVFNEYGFSKKFTIKVNNIDKTSPKGTCVVTHNKNGSIITISASDSSGISKYIYDGREYTNNKIYLDYYLEDAPVVKFYDAVGNFGNATCSVSEIPDEYLVNSSYYSSNNGINSPDITYVDVSDLSCNIFYGYSNPVGKIAMHKIVANNFHGILGLVCNYVNDTPWLENLQHAGGYTSGEVTQHNYHSKGLAIDLNNLWSYTYNGKTYRPYSHQGVYVWNNYKDFICEVCDGKEDCPYNVNYIIFKRYFEGNGWCWGGNWGPEWFDPMHFELTEGGCYIEPQREITC